MIGARRGSKDENFVGVLCVLCIFEIEILGSCADDDCLQLFLEESWVCLREFDSWGSENVDVL